MASEQAQQTRCRRLCSWRPVHSITLSELMSMKRVSGLESKSWNFHDFRLCLPLECNMWPPRCSYWIPWLSLTLSQSDWSHFVAKGTFCELLPDVPSARFVSSVNPFGPWHFCVTLTHFICERPPPENTRWLLVSDDVGQREVDSVRILEIWAAMGNSGVTLNTLSRSTASGRNKSWK